MDEPYRSADGTAYRLRPASVDDAAAVVALHNAVWAAYRPVEWFRWKYVDVPPVDHVPVFVALHDDDVVGALGHLPFRVRHGDATGLGMLGGDLVVHPDHRRRGLFRRLFAFVQSFYAEDGPVPASERPDFLFSYANENSRPGILSMGWQEVAPRTSYRRTNDPRSFVADRVGPTAGRVLGRAGRTLAGGYAGLRSRFAAQPTDVAVTRYDDLPVETLASLAARDRPGALHPVHDEAFYNWRFSGPTWSPDATFVARRRGTPVAALVTRTHTDDNGATTVSLVHTAPLSGGEDWEDGVAAALDHLLVDYRRVDFVRAWNPVYPPRLLRERGFLSDDRFPLSLVTGSDLTLATCRFPWSRFDDATLATARDYLWSLDK